MGLVEAPRLLCLVCFNVRASQMPPYFTSDGTMTQTSPLLWEDPLEGQLDENCAFAHVGKIEVSEGRENESKEALQYLKLQIVF